ncbi:MAG: gamma-glutamyltransferase [Balneolaceae bacterium]
MTNKLLNILSPILLLILFLVPELQAQTGWAHPYSESVVVVAEEFAGQAGLEILNQGGNAVDAAVAVQFALAVTLPRAGNIGGGGFMVLHLQDGTIRTLDFREKAPLHAYRDMYLDEDGEYITELSRTGALASGVPGTVDGMITALEHYGRLPLETVMQPAIRLAKEGFLISRTLADELNEFADQLRQFPSSAAYFTKSGDERWQQGDHFVQNDLGETLERIARYGRRGFYTGITAQRIVITMREQGGIIDYEDLRTYRSSWREPLQTDFEGYTLYMMPPPSSGGFVIQQTLEMLKDFDVRSLGFNSADYVHLLSETWRRSFADRNYHLGDPDFADISPVLQTRQYNRDRMRRFDPERATPSSDLSHGEPPIMLESSETTHFSILDREGNAVAVTTTLNGSFGNKLAVQGGGFLLNNEMDDFSAKPGEPNMFGLIGAEANAIQPGKRMLSSMTPTIVTRNGQVRMILGAAGGPRIITATLQNFLNLALFDMNIQQAIHAPRFHHQWLPDQITVEPFALSRDTETILRERGHTLSEMESIGRSHIIYVDEEGRKYGAADPRGDGSVHGR